MLMSLTKNRLLLVALIALCIALPTKLSHAQMSERLLKKHQQGMAGKSLYDDPELAAYVEKVGRKVLANSDHAGREYHFFLTDHAIPGASTVGSGLIYIDRGLLALLNSEAQLAGVIGHEIGHGFDDSGSTFDGDGVLRNWWTDKDKEEFKARTAKLIAQYDEFKPYPDINVNGEFTLGENIGIAYVPKDYSAVGSEIWVDIRGRAAKATVVETPFVRK